MIFLVLCGSDEPLVLTVEQLLIVKNAFEKYYRTVFVFCNSRLNDTDASEDIAQGVFLTFMENISKIEKNPDINIKGWLLTTARNKTSNHIRSLSKKVLLENYESEINKLASPSAEDDYFNISDAEIEATKQKILSELPDKLREWYQTYFDSNLSHEEIAKKYNISVVASKKRKSHLKVFLKIIIKKQKEK